MSHGLSSKREWIQRVSETHAAEGLCDREWRFLAASSALLAGLNATVSFVGRRLSEIPQFKHQAGAMAAVPFFNGSLRSVQFHSEAWIDGDLRAWDKDFWAVCTSECEILVHMVANRVPARATAAFPGFRVSDLRVIAADGRVVAVDGTDAALPR